MNVEIITSNRIRAWAVDAKYRGVLLCGIGFVAHVDREVDLGGSERWHFGGGFGVLVNVIIRVLSGDRGRMKRQGIGITAGIFQRN